MDFLFQTRAFNVVKSKRAGQSGPVCRPEINPSADVFPQNLGRGIGVWGSKLHGQTLNQKPVRRNLWSVCGLLVQLVEEKHNCSQAGPTGLRPEGFLDRGCGTINPHIQWTAETAGRR